MKLEILLNNEEALKALAAAPLTDSQLAWDLSEAIEEAEKHLKRFIETRNDLIKKHGVEDKDAPGEFKVSDLKAFNAELAKLVEVDVKVKFPNVRLSAFNGLAVSAGNLKAWRQLKIVTKK
jgi:hypothetical protein